MKASWALREGWIGVCCRAASTDGIRRLSKLRERSLSGHTDPPIPSLNRICSGVRWLSKVKPSQVAALAHHASASAMLVVFDVRIPCPGPRAPTSLIKPAASGWPSGLSGSTESSSCPGLPCLIHIDCVFVRDDRDDRCQRRQRVHVEHQRARDDTIGTEMCTVPREIELTLIERIHDTANLKVA